MIVLSYPVFVSCAPNGLLWYRVLKARYGEVEGRLTDGGGGGSVWWRTLCRVREGVGEGVGGWFDDNVRRIVGEGRDTLFWHDTWVGDTSLKLKFPRLFDLYVNKESTMEEMARLGWEVGGRGGSGDVVCWRGRRKVWRSALLCYTILFCRLQFMILGGGYLILFMVIRFEEHTILLLLQGQLLIVIWLMMFGIGVFPQRSPCLCSDSFVIDCLLKIIWQDGGAFQHLTRHVRLFVVIWKHQSICFWIVLRLVLFGLLCYIG